MFSAHLPEWLRTSPAFRTAIAEARADVEAERADIARTIARLQADTDKQAPKLDAALLAAKAKQADAWTAYEHATRAVQLADTAVRELRDRYTTAHRTASQRLAELADPSIRPALAAIDHALELHRHETTVDPVTAAARFTALSEGRRTVAALLTATGEDAPRVVDNVMHRLNLTPTE